MLTLRAIVIVWRNHILLFGFFRLGSVLICVYVCALFRPTVGVSHSIVRSGVQCQQLKALDRWGRTANETVARRPAIPDVRFKQRISLVGEETFDNIVLSAVIIRTMRNGRGYACAVLMLCGVGVC